MRDEFAQHTNAWNSGGRDDRYMLIYNLLWRKGDNGLQKRAALLKGWGIVFGKEPRSWGDELNYTHSQMMEIFDAAIKVAKLQTFS